MYPNMKKVQFLIAINYTSAALISEGAPGLGCEHDTLLLLRPRRMLQLQLTELTCTKWQNNIAKATSSIGYPDCSKQSSRQSPKSTEIFSSGIQSLFSEWSFDGWLHISFKMSVALELVTPSPTKLIAY